VFDVLLKGYTQSLEAYYLRSKEKSDEEKKPRTTLGKLEQALSAAQKVLQLFRETETN
jgi:hypothetical protein